MCEKKIRPGNGKIDWDGTVSYVVERDEKNVELIEYCEKCGKAGAEIHDFKGIGDNRHIVCENCRTKSLRHTSVESLGD